MHKVALEHSKSTGRHHKFELVGSAVLHVVRTGDDDTDTRFETFYSNVKNAEEFATTKALDLSLVQARAFVKGFSDKAGLNCCACNSTSCLVATYNSMHKIEGEKLKETNKKLYKFMGWMNNELNRRSCFLSDDYLYILAYIESNNFLAGEICPMAKGLYNKPKKKTGVENVEEDPNHPEAKAESSGENINVPKKMLQNSVEKSNQPKPGDNDEGNEESGDNLFDEDTVEALNKAEAEVLATKTTPQQVRKPVAVVKPFVNEAEQSSTIDSSMDRAGVSDGGEVNMSIEFIGEVVTISSSQSELEISSAPSQPVVEPASNSNPSPQTSTSEKSGRKRKRVLKDWALNHQPNFDDNPWTSKSCSSSDDPTNVLPKPPQLEEHQCSGTDADVETEGASDSTTFTPSPSLLSQVLFTHCLKVKNRVSVVEVVWKKNNARLDNVWIMKRSSIRKIKL